MSAPAPTPGGERRIEIGVDAGWCQEACGVAGAVDGGLEFAGQAAGGVAILAVRWAFGIWCSGGGRCSVVLLRFLAVVAVVIAVLLAAGIVARWDSEEIADVFEGLVCCYF